MRLVRFGVEGKRRANMAFFSVHKLSTDLSTGLSTGVDNSSGVGLARAMQARVREGNPEARAAGG